VPVTLYFSSETPDGDSYYVPVTRLINRTDNLLKASVDQLIAGPLDQSQLIGVMTPDVQVKSVVPKDNTITVNLQDESMIEGQTEPDEMLQAIILSVTENANATASKVQITLNGNTNLMTEPVSRPTYVNALKS
jgi:germination protein M